MKTFEHRRRASVVAEIGHHSAVAIVSAKLPAATVDESGFAQGALTAA